MVALGTAVLSLFPVAEALAEYVRCESRDDGRRTYCDVRDARDARISLSRQYSKASCEEGYSWGTDSRGIWVDRGCRAEFEVRYSGYDSGRDSYESDRMREERERLERERIRLEEERRRLEEQSRQAPPAQCPPGARPGKCTPEQRSRQGCKDWREPSGIGCYQLRR